MQIKYRIATIEDVSVLTEHRILFVLELSGEQPLDKTTILREQLNTYFYRAISDSSCISFIATCEDEIAGIGSMHIREMPGNFKNPSGRWGYIMNMYTVPKFRKQGICKKLLTLLVEEGKLQGLTAFELHATKDGEPIYVSDGFAHHTEPTMRKYL